VTSHAPSQINVDALLQRDLCCPLLVAAVLRIKFNAHLAMSYSYDNAQTRPTLERVRVTSLRAFYLLTDSLSTSDDGRELAKCWIGSTQVCGVSQLMGERHSICCIVAELTMTVA